MLNLFRELYDHMRWADAVVWRAALAHAPAGKDKRLRDLFAHLHMVQHAFLSVWRGEAPQWCEFERLADVAPWARAYHDDVRPHLAALDDAALARTMVMPWADRLSARYGRAAAAPTTLRETMLQVPMHSTYHRGQVNARLRELGAEPPLTDYIAWLWFGKPAAEWP
jgi:uncharacterized damage-inducible protein DinB